MIILLIYKELFSKASLYFMLNYLSILLSSQMLTNRVGFSSIRVVELLLLLSSPFHTCIPVQIRIHAQILTNLTELSHETFLVVLYPYIGYGNCLPSVFCLFWVFCVCVFCLLLLFGYVCLLMFISCCMLLCVLFWFLRCFAHIKRN